MKKVLSVLLAAAMVMGMSVTSFAASWGSASDVDLKHTCIDGTVVKESLNDVVGGFDGTVYVVDGSKLVGTYDATDDFKLEPGYDLYFAMTNTKLVWVPASADDKEVITANVQNVSFDAITGEIKINGLPANLGTPRCAEDTTKFNKVATDHTVVAKAVEDSTLYVGEIDEDWSINYKGDDVVTNASFYSVPKTNKPAWAKSFAAKTKFVKVELADDFDSTSITETVDFDLYIADHEFTKMTSEHAIFNNIAFANTGRATVSFKYTNDADDAYSWKAAEAGEATFDFNDNVYYTVKMVKDEVVVLNLSRSYDKDIDKAYNENDGELEFYNFKGSKDAFYRIGDLFIPADEATYIYGVELDKDGEVEDIWAIEDAKWTDEYTIAGMSKEYEGWVISTDELGYYIVSDEELVLPVEEEVEEPATEPEVPAEPEKANPETGAADFVGAAVAMAVVSVAAAGALALKK